MYRLEYHIGKKLVESFYFPSRQLANLKKGQLKGTGQYELGTFKIVMT
jgi:hypothetical protein